MIVGDGACGKTCLLIVFSRDEFPEVPVVNKFWQRNRAVRYEKPGAASSLTASFVVIFLVGDVNALKPLFCFRKPHRNAPKKKFTKFNFELLQAHRVV